MARRGNLDGNNGWRLTPETENNMTKQKRSVHTLAEAANDPLYTMYEFKPGKHYVAEIDGVRKEVTSKMGAKFKAIGGRPHAEVVEHQVDCGVLKHCECYNCEDAEICTEEAVREQVRQAEVEARS